MCGIFIAVTAPGFLAHEAVMRSVSTLTHRGPDHLGILKIPAHGHEIWFGHTRLSILDISTAANQPFTASDGSVLVFNGEIYNHRELRSELNRDWNFKTNSDTEVLLAGMQKHGDEFFAKTNGMFASVYFDSSKSELIIGRDRVGKKPLYVYRSSEMLVYASELKAIVALGVRLSIDELAKSYYRWLGYVPAELSIYNECKKFPAASSQRVHIGSEIREQDFRSYWDPLRVCYEKYQGSYEEAQREFLELLDDATRIRLAADVPVGVFLSGGVDSSLIATSVARVQTKKTTVFTVASTDHRFDESSVAIETSKQLGLEIEVLPVTENDYSELEEKLAYHFDEPFADQSAIPTMAISRAAAKHVKVVLTGDGGDESFCGYPWHCYPKRLYRFRPPFTGIKMIKYGYHALLDTKIANASMFLVAKSLGMNIDNLAVKRQFCHDLVDADDSETLYDTFQCAENIRLLSDNDQICLGKASLMERVKNWQKFQSWDSLRHRNTAERLACLDIFTYLRDGVLVKVDRSTMAFSLEARSPLLDYRIIEFGLRIPFHFKVDGKRHKRLLRDALKTRLGGVLSDLPKKGFGVPLPKDLPHAASPRGRWVRWVESKWHSRWGTGYSTSV